jgi:hypothetical protein
MDQGETLTAKYVGFKSKLALCREREERRIVQESGRTTFNGLLLTRLHYLHLHL